MLSKILENMVAKVFFLVIIYLMVAKVNDHAFPPIIDIYINIFCQHHDL